MSDKIHIEKIIRLAISEDKIHNDITSKLSFSKLHKSKVKVISKNQGIIFGLNVIKKLIRFIDNNLKITVKVKDGQNVKKNQVIFLLSGKTISILKSERTLLNFLGHLSGIATETNKLKKITNNKVKICCTRKTLPGLRYLQKKAVLAGGGVNNRYNLESEIFVKDNHHIDKVDFRKKIISIIKKNKQKKIITVEVDNIRQLKQINDLKINRILFDNFKPNELKKALKVTPKKIETEASGNITPTNIVSYANTGVDRISLGYLTHSVKNFDLSLIFD